MKCGHHRQRLEDGSLLPCATPECPEAAKDEVLVVAAPFGPRCFTREAVPESMPRQAFRKRYLWRERA